MFSEKDELIALVVRWRRDARQIEASISSGTLDRAAGEGVMQLHRCAQDVIDRFDISKAELEEPK